MKTKQSAIDSTTYKLDGNKLYHFNTNGVAISVTEFIKDKNALEEFNRVTGSFRKQGRPCNRKRECATVYYNQLIIQL